MVYLRFAVLWAVKLAFGEFIYIVLGLGYMFIGFIWYKFLLILIGFVATLAGLFSISLLKDGKDYL